MIAKRLDGGYWSLSSRAMAAFTYLQYRVVYEINARHFNRQHFLVYHLILRPIDASTSLYLEPDAPWL